MYDKISNFIEKRALWLIILTFAFLLFCFHYFGVRYNEQVKVDKIKNNLKQFTMHRDAYNVLLIARVINKEVNGCSVDDKIAVASSIINRLEDGRYGSTIKEVIFKQNQYVSGEDITRDDIAVAYAVYSMNVRNCDIRYFFNPRYANKLEMNKIRRNSTLLLKTKCHEYYG
jgi:spore germination cell wall hydrolase CwlJ-like protein